MSQFSKIFEKDFATVEINTFDGPKIYKFRRLKSKEGSRVYHNSISGVLQVVADVVGSLGSKEKKISLLNDLDHDTVFWPVAKALIDGCSIQPNKENLKEIVSIENLDETDYFDEDREELYLAVGHALQASYPKSFARLGRAISPVFKDFGPLILDLKGRLSNLVSTQKPQDSTQSQNSSG